MNLAELAGNAGEYLRYLHYDELGCLLFLCADHIVRIERKWYRIIRETSRARLWSRQHDDVVSSGLVFPTSQRTSSFWRTVDCRNPWRKALSDVKRCWVFRDVNNALSGDAIVVSWVILWSGFFNTKSWVMNEWCSLSEINILCPLFGK